MPWQGGHEGSGHIVKTNVLAGELAALSPPGKRKEGQLGACPFSPLPDYVQMEGEEGTQRRADMRETDKIQYFCHGDSFYRQSFPGYEEDTRTPGAMTGGGGETGGRSRRD